MYNIAVLGAGGIAGGIHLPLLARNPALRVASVCDLRPERARAAAERFDIPAVYTSYHEMLAKETPDAVFVLTQPDALFRAVSDCLLGGYPVFMEKPMGITAYQAQTLAAIARERDLLLHVGYNRRYIPLVVEALRILREVAPLSQAEGRFYKNSGAAFYGGCASAFPCDVVHCIDLVRHAMGQPVTGCALLETVAPEMAEAADRANSWHGVMRFAGGGSGVVRSHYATGGRVHGFEFHAPGASAYINLGFEGGADCEATILLAKGRGRQSLSAMGGAEHQSITLDGRALAGSNEYADYYGYRDEHKLFFAALAMGGKFDASRTAEDLASADLVEQLLAARI
ncbi:MAG: Gfo/Idh/MocA family oxidoreductase [Oscillospiraceae bacterium]|jgi:virulence factor|nr:Gfo/Idh/MocA family oxidoreductase [Oscillospiraceae bacterium]